MARWPRRRGPSPRGSTQAGIGRGQTRRDLGREPARVDRRVLGLPAERGHRWSRSTTARRAPSSRRVADIVDARALLLGDVVERETVETSRSAWSPSELRPDRDPRSPARRRAHAMDHQPAARRSAERCAQRRARDHRRRHRRDHLHLGRDRRSQGRGHHPPQRARQHRAGRARDREVPPLHAAVPADPLPQPAAAQPHVRAGDGDLHPADAAGRGGLHAQLRTRTTSSGRSSRGASRCWCACRRSSRCCAST